MATEFENLENKLCDYGCGQIAKYKFKNGKYCCSERYCGCPIEKEKNRKGQKGKKMPSYKEIENSDNKLCDYGCGQIARFQFKNGKYCCSSNMSQCSSIIIKNINSSLGKKIPLYKEIENLENKLCDYGCGQIAKFQFRGGKVCCGEHYTKCPIEREKIKKINAEKGKSIYKKIENLENKLCDYGCGQIARFQLKNGKYCCSSHYLQCSVIRERSKRTNTGKGKSIYKKIENLDNKLCDYGCGQIAKFQFKNGKYCCKDYFMSCPSEKKRISYKKIENLDNKLCDYGCGQIAKFQFKNGKYCCSNNIMSCPSERKKRNDIGRKLIFTYKLVLKRYPDLIRIENLIEGHNGKVLGRCKNSNCKRTKETDGYFELSMGQIYYRNLGINSTSDNDYFYCCEECKKECVLYGKSSTQLQNIFNPQGDLSKASTQDLSIWRNEVFTQQLKDNPSHSENFCEICHKTENLVGHHILPQKLYPEFALDPGNGIVLCEKCHTKYGHTKGTECSTGSLANTNCK
jgi:hypothetical protein